MAAKIARLQRTAGNRQTTTILARCKSKVPSLEKEKIPTRGAANPDTSGVDWQKVALLDGAFSLDPKGIGISVKHEVRPRNGAPIKDGNICEQVKTPDISYELPLAFREAIFEDFHLLPHKVNPPTAGDTQQLWFRKGTDHNTVIPESGFKITRSVQAGGGDPPIFQITITKMPADVSLEGLTARPGEGAPVTLSFAMQRSGDAWKKHDSP